MRMDDCVLTTHAAHWTMLFASKIDASNRLTVPAAPAAHWTVAVATQNEASNKGRAAATQNEASNKERVPAAPAAPCMVAAPYKMVVLRRYRLDNRAESELRLVACRWVRTM